jgi:hypothetical protein
MTTQTDLEQAYSANLAGHAPVASAGQANDAFEVYVLTLALRAAQGEGGTILFQSDWNLRGRGGWRTSRMRYCGCGNR